jgi:Eukaryotic aspartyl protease
MREVIFLSPLFVTYDYRASIGQLPALLPLIFPATVLVTRQYFRPTSFLCTLFSLLCITDTFDMYLLALLALTAFANALPVSDNASSERATSQLIARSLQITSNVAELQRVSGDGPTSSKFLHAICSQGSLAGQDGTEYGQADLISAELGQVFITNVSFGGQIFEAVIDTGSSDTWLVETGFTCVNQTDNSTLTEADCYFGSSGYSPDSAFIPIPDENFNISYTDGEYLNGFFGYDMVTFSGITVQQQEVALGKQP